MVDNLNYKLRNWNSHKTVRNSGWRKREISISFWDSVCVDRVETSSSYRRQEVENFPKNWNKTTVTVNVKQGKDATRVDNFWPISFLSSTSKIFERLVQRRVYDYFRIFDVLIPEQVTPAHQPERFPPFIS